MQKTNKFPIGVVKAEAITRHKRKSVQRTISSAKRFLAASLIVLPRLSEDSRESEEVLNFLLKER